MTNRRPTRRVNIREGYKVCTPKGQKSSARVSTLGLEFGHFEDGFQGAARSVARAIGEEEIQKSTRLSKLVE